MGVYLDDDRDWPTLVGTGTEDLVGSAWGLGRLDHLYQGAYWYQTLPSPRWPAFETYGDRVKDLGFPPPKPYADPHPRRREEPPLSRAAQERRSGRKRLESRLALEGGGTTARARDP
ncbi:MAG TPA: DUF2961 domain-containing protein [Vicinamibacteria bacterium]|nr:DUF2961 domain-containing protein [Vicinamibacteria bacterium]